MTDGSKPAERWAEPDAMREEGQNARAAPPAGKPGPRRFVTERVEIRRASPVDQPLLASLLELSRQIETDDVKSGLSQITRAMLRAEFPADGRDVRAADFSSGLTIAADVSDVFGAEFHLGHVNEADDLEAVVGSLPVDAAVVDVGANFGLYALYAARFAPEARVVAFEPLPSAFEILERNRVRNALTERVRTVRAAVSDAPGRAKLYVAADSAFSGLRDTERSPLQEVIDVEVTTLDADAAVAALGPVDFLKIDVEGAEAAVLRGAQATVARSPELVILLEYTHKNLTADQEAELWSELDRLSAQDFVIWRRGPEGPSPVRSRGELGERFSGNLFLWRPGSELGARLQRALERPSAAAGGALAPAAAWLLGELLTVRQSADELAAAERSATRRAEEYAQSAATWRARREQDRHEAETQRALVERQKADLAALQASVSLFDAELARKQELVDQLRRDNAALQATTRLYDTELARKQELVDQLRRDNAALADAAQTRRAALEQSEADLARLRHAAEGLRASNEALIQERERLLLEHGDHMQATERAEEERRRLASSLAEADAVLRERQIKIARLQIAYDAVVRRFRWLRWLFPRQARLGEHLGEHDK